MRILVLLLTLSTSALAEHIYLAQTNLGTADGASAANAKIYTFFNTASNWDQLVNTTNGKIGPGDTVHLVGVINLAVALNWQNTGGTVGNPITLKFDPGAQLRHPTGIDGNGMIHLFGQSNVIIEGGNSLPVINAYNGATDFRAPSGYQEDMVVTANGTGSGQVSSRMMHGENLGSNVTVRNLWMYGLYIRTYQHPSDVMSGNAPGAAISLRSSGNNVVIENCAVVHGETGLNVSALSSGIQTGFRISDCLVTDNSNGIKMGVGSSNLVNPQIVRNRIDHNARWGGIADGGFHSDGIQTIATTAGGRCDNLHVAYNHLGPYLGLSGDITAFIFLEDFVNGSKIYNNILEKGRGHTSNGVIDAGTHASFSGQPFESRTIIAFNTLIHSTDDPFPRLQSRAMGSTTALVVGNIISHVARWLLLSNNDSFAGGPLNNWSDYNVFYEYDPTDDPFSLFGTVGPNGGYDVTQWQAGHPTSITPYDLHSLVSSNPLFVDTISPVDVHLQSGSPARNFVPTTVDGFNFTTLFTDDFYGTPRGPGPWDAGAVKFAATGPVPPTVASSTINAAGTQFAVLMSEVSVFGAGGSGGMSVASTGGTVTLGTPIIAGSTITWPITNRLIGQSEVLTRSYTQPGNGIEAQDDQQDLASFSLAPITNSSTVLQAAMPQFAPLPGTYSSTQNVAITSTTSGATIRYTTNGVDPTSSTGTLYTTPISTSLSTTYKARAFANGFLDSPVATGAFQIGDFIINTGWSNVAVATQTGTFTWTFRATPSATGIDGLMALADHNAGAFTDLAVILRFNSAGRVDAMNTSDYTAVNVFNYVGGQAYDFVVTVNVPAHTYSVTVVQAGGSTPITIATNYGFRSQQATVNHLDVFSGITALGTISLSNMVFTGAAPTLSLTGIATNPAGTQITASFNSQPSFGLGGQGGFTVSASGGATTPSAPTVGTNSITWNLSRTIGRGESISATYVQPGNGIEAASGGADLASFAGQSAVNNSTVDLTAPTPNPSTFGIAPTALTSSTITMTATNSSDANSPPVQYFFNEVSGNAGGSDSGWQSSSTFTDAGLAAGTQYRYRVQVRDSAVPPNVTTFSQEFSATTKSVAGARPAQPFNMARANIVTP